VESFFMSLGKVPTPETASGIFRHGSDKRLPNLQITLGRTSVLSGEGISKIFFG
jgi:hypothetical protein